MIFLDKVDRKSGLRKFYIDVVPLGKTAAPVTDLSGGLTSYHVVPVTCRPTKALFSTDTDITASNGVVVAIKNETVSANIIAQTLHSACTTTEEVTGSLDWTANGVLYRTATNTALISAGSLISFNASATAGTAGFACTIEFDVDTNWDRGGYR